MKKGCPMITFWMNSDYTADENMRRTEEVPVYGRIRNSYKRWD